MIGKFILFLLSKHVCDPNCNMHHFFLYYVDSTEVDKKNPLFCTNKGQVKSRKKLIREVLFFKKKFYKMKALYWEYKLASRFDKDNKKRITK